MTPAEQRTWTLVARTLRLDKPLGGALPYRIYEQKTERGGALLLFEDDDGRFAVCYVPPEDRA